MSVFMRDAFAFGSRLLDRRASAGRSSSTVTPGSSRPSRNSSEAPPPVEMWVIRSARPCWVDGGDRVAATDDDRRARVGALGEHPRDGLRAVRERRDLEHAQRPVPEHGLDVGQRLDHQVLAGLAEVDDVPRGRDLLGLERLVLGARG